MNITIESDYYNGDKTYLQIVVGQAVALGITISPGGAALDLTGYGLKGQIDFPTPLVLTDGNGGFSFINAPQGQIQLNISTDVSASLPQGAFPYDLWVVSPNGQEYPFLNGNFIVEPNIATVP